MEGFIIPALLAGAAIFGTLTIVIVQFIQLARSGEHFLES